MIYAPIIIPTLCRSKHFIRLMESLKKNTWACYTDVYVGLDFPPSEKYEKGWREICEYLERGEFSVFKKFTVFKRDCNYGASKNSLALTQFVKNRYDRWIRTDDDCEFSPNFLEYMDKCLSEYEKDERVFAVTGYSYPIKWTVKNEATCFLQNFNVAMWGAGFWKDKHQRAQKFICDRKLLKAVKNCVRNRLYEEMIDACKIDYFGAAVACRHVPWLMVNATDVALRAYLAIEGMFCVSPVVSKVRNYGFDGTGCYCVASEGSAYDAQNYCYSNQVLDECESFDLCLDDNVEHLNENRGKLNRFDSRSSKDVLYVRRIIWLINYFGLGFAKLYHGMNMLSRKLRKK